MTQGEYGRVLCNIEKKSKLSLILSSESQKFLVSDLGFFFLNLCNKELSLPGRIGQLDYLVVLDSPL